MPFKGFAVGRLGAEPEVRMVSVKGKQRPVLEMPVYLNKGLEIELPNGDVITPATKFIVWNENDQKWITKLAKAGSVVQATGKTKFRMWENKNKETRATAYLIVDSIEFFSLGSGNNDGNDDKQKNNKPNSSNQSNQSKPPKQNQQNDDDLDLGDDEFYDDFDSLIDDEI